MAEVENVVENNVQTKSEKPSLGKRFVGGVKERIRKLVVKLKRRPMNIAFLFLIISSIIYLCMLGNLSQAGIKYHDTGVPISVFVNTLFSILVLLLFMYSFPKREKKPKIVMLVLTFVFMAIMIGLDVFLYYKWNSAWTADQELLNESQLAGIREYIDDALNGVLVHLIFVALALVLTATYPLYGKLINKINTRKNVESTELKETLDTSEEV